MNAGKNNNIGFCFGCILCKAQTVSNIICHILYIRLLVIVRQDHGIHLPFEPRDLLLQIEVRERRLRRDLYRRNHEIVKSGLQSPQLL